MLGFELPTIRSFSIALISTLSETTEGIEMSEFPFVFNEHEPAIAVRTWDFAGQAVFHATHSYFLSERSVYVVVWNINAAAENSRYGFFPVSSSDRGFHQHCFF